MDRVEAHELARSELKKIQNAGYGAAAEHIDTVILKEEAAASGTPYEVELSHLWEGPAQDKILVICRIGSKAWFKHEHLEESVTLSSRPN